MTRSFPKPTPAWLLAYHAQHAPAGGDKAAGGTRGRSTIREECPKCKHPFMEFYTMQLRSADEGQTVFYECPSARCVRRSAGGFLRWLRISPRS